MDDASKQRDLESLQDALYREKVLRARAMSPSERLEEAFTLTSEVFEQMHAGAMVQLRTTDPVVGWDEVERRLSRLRAAEETGFYTTRPKVAS